MSILFKAGCFSLFMGIASAGLSSAYAEEKKALALEGAVFDLKSSSSLMVYGNVSDKKRYPVSDATVTLKPSRGSAKETSSDSAGLYSFTGVEDGMSYSLSASKEGLGRSKKVNFKIQKGETGDFVIGLNFKKVSVPGGKPTPTPTTTPSSNGKPEDLVHIPLYSNANPFVKEIESNPEIDPNSDAMVEGLVSQAAIGFVIAQKQWTVPVFYADESTPRYDVTLKCGKEWELGVTQLKNVPIPDWAEPSDDNHEGEINPDGCGGSDNGPDEGDFAMAVIDTATRCEYDFWQAKKTKGKWAASWANSISIDSDSIFEKGLSCRGSGFALLNGLIWPDELKAGRIDHAIAFSYDLTRAGGPVSPATDSDGTSKGSDTMPEGARVQLDPTLDLDSLGLTDYEKTIAKALQEYGMILVDDGGGMAFYVVHPLSAKNNPYEGILPDKDYASLENIPVDKFRVLKLPEQNSDWQDNLGVVENACADFE
ncbi:MAG: carboxypeptidase regulatory-like domain-containing protein [Planctomycetes bacterium]|uniref:carboxypeptidase-like regulatory domain-containing protein n=1 Tax=Candidatus Wunengus sp. YC65 TaxID=3367701 RepID=UPI001E0EB72C|nr:carboxypeptidase regulatory-like domain-containing protein [Planctomycetota bacterium]